MIATSMSEQRSQNGLRPLKIEYFISHLILIFYEEV